MKNKHLYSILTLILVALLIIPTNVLALNDKEETVLVRVGYTENYGIIKYPTFENNEGYGYEYLNKINEYTDTNYEFEYILCAWSDGLKMLETGELDILGPAHYTQERAETFTYSENSIGKDMLIVTSLDPDYLTESSYQKFDNGTILIREGDASLSILQEFIDKNNYNTTIIESDDMDIQGELERQEYDFLFSGSMQMEVNLNIVTTLGSSPVYLMARNECQDIIADFDNAIELINNTEYMFQEQLYIKYFSHNTIENEYITDAEYSLLRSEDIYNVGVENLYTNLGNNTNNQIAGVYVDIVNFIANKAEINVNLVEINKNSTQSDLDKLDFYLPVNVLSELRSPINSISYMQTPILLITADNYDIDASVTVGVLDYYGLDEDNIRYISNEKHVKIYNDINVLINDFVVGEITKIMLTDATYRIFYQDINHRDHTTKSTTYLVGPKFSYSATFPQEKIEVIDKLITHISDEFIETALIKHIALTSDTLYTNAMKSYMQIIFWIVLVAIVIIYHARAHKKKELERLANVDDLTGLSTQSKFIEEVRTTLRTDYANEYSLIAFDIDNFKYINEIYGFDTGSAILKLTANYVKTHIAKDLPFSRLSNDHFIILTKRTNSDDPHTLFTELNSNSKIHREFHPLIDKAYFISFSAGCFDIDNRNLDVNYMIDCCNLARSYSKDELGTSLHVFSEDMREKERIKNNIVSRMNQAVNDKEFVLFYQPKFNINTQEIVGAEALVRWFADGKMMPPNDFIPLFEKNGFIETLDYYVINAACEFVGKFANQTLPIISVNLSGVTIMKPDVVSRIVEIINRHSVDPKRIDIEITESAFVDHFELAISRIDELRALGFTISMDDFGAGISSLGRLKGISLDILKIDREFIIESFENEKADKIFRNIINMAKDLKLETVAEGIETAEQLEFLKEISCDVGQGYFFSRPLPEKDFLELLVERNGLKL